MTLTEEFEPNKDELWEEMGDPVLVIAKYGTGKKDFDDKFSPAISVFVNHKNEVINEDEDMALYDFEDIAGMISYASSRILKDYTIKKDITPYPVSNCNAYESKWDWTFESIEHKKKWKCSTWTILVEKGDYIYSFNMTDSEEASELAGDTFRAFVDTIKIV